MVHFVRFVEVSCGIDVYSRVKVSEYCIEFYIGSLTNINDRLQDLKNAGIEEVIAVSADKLDVARSFAAELKIAFPIGYGLEVSQMRTLGTYVSSPTHYIEQEHEFSEPAYFVLNADNTIRYIDIASAPFGGRVNVDNLIAGLTYVTQREKDEPEFGRVIWGSK